MVPGPSTTAPETRKMAKFHGAIGHVVSTQTSDGVWEDVVTEVTYSGDVTRNTVRQTEGGKINADLTVGNSISIVATPYALDNISTMRYLVWMGVRWIIAEVEVQRPRLKLRLGGKYNGPAYVPPSTP